MAENQAQKPCLVQTTQGFSVSYNGRLLYSKYAPARAILSKIASLKLLPGTILLCCSAVLPYGLAELKSRLPEDCIILLAEADEGLYEFTKMQEHAASFPLLTRGELYRLPVILNSQNQTLECGARLPPPGTFRRLVRIDFSAGTALSPDFYSTLESAAVNALMTWWANRVTLVKFGRKYSAGLFRNLRRVEASVPIHNYFHCITKPIIVCGAGESLDQGIKDFKQNRSAFFILCADTALLPLQQNGIQPDGVFVEEAQGIILRAFLGRRRPGSDRKKITIFASLSSTPQLSHSVKDADFSYFTTAYSDALFFKRLEEASILPPRNMPFGSVGITAVHYALSFRQNDEIPVYVYGLDFSYSAGRTHARGAMAHMDRLLLTDRLRGVPGYEASFGPGRTKIQGKDGKEFFTTPAMAGYARLFSALFEGTKNLFDSGKCGIPLALPQKTPSEKACIQEPLKKQNTGKTTAGQAQKIKEFLEQEKNALTELRELLTGSKRMAEEERAMRIRELAEPREYLYLHFPDGWKFSMELSFLKRIRAETDYFLKIFSE